MLCAIPGTDLRALVQKIRNYYIEKENLKIEEPIDFEDNLYRFLNEKKKDELFKNFKIENVISMFNLTENISRKILFKYWDEFTDTVHKNILKSKSEIIIFSLHTTYFDNRKKSFFSLHNFFKIFDKLKPSHIIFFIDDIYDMYYRLLKKGELINYKDSLIKKEIFDLKDVIDVKFNFVNKILQWRNLELVISENLANSLNAKFLIYSTKQSLEGICKWIYYDYKLFYLSHPITRLRIEMINSWISKISNQLYDEIIEKIKEDPKGDHEKDEFKNSLIEMFDSISEKVFFLNEKINYFWDNHTAEINNLQTQFLQKNILIIMPTGLDEFRFLKLDKKIFSKFNVNYSKILGSFTKFYPILTPRYPLPKTKEDDQLIFEEGLNQDYIHFFQTSLLDLGVKNFNEFNPVFKDNSPFDLNITSNSYKGILPYFNYRLLSLNENIEMQISSRDHSLVIYCGSLLVYRPFYLVPRFSGGVEAEIRNWINLTKFDNSEKIIFIHFFDDLNQIDNNQLELLFKVENFKKNLFDTFKQKTNAFESLNNSQIIFGELDYTNIPVAIRNMIEPIYHDYNSLKYEISVSWLTNYLTYDISVYKKEFENKVISGIFRDYLNFNEFINNLKDFSSHSFEKSQFPEHLINNVSKFLLNIIRDEIISSLINKLGQDKKDFIKSEVIQKFG